MGPRPPAAEVQGVPCRRVVTRSSAVNRHLGEVWGLVRLLEAMTAFCKRRGVLPAQPAPGDAVPGCDLTLRLAQRLGVDLRAICCEQWSGTCAWVQGRTLPSR